MVPMMLEAMRQFPETLLVQQQTVSFLAHEVKTLEDCQHLDRFYGLELSLSAMQRFPQSSLLQTHGARVTWKMASLSDDFFGRIKGHGGAAMAARGRGGGGASASEASVRKKDAPALARLRRKRAESRAGGGASEASVRKKALLLVLLF
jgi:hypothetical protein